MAIAKRGDWIVFAKEQRSTSATFQTSTDISWRVEKVASTDRQGIVTKVQNYGGRPMALERGAVVNVIQGKLTPEQERRLTVAMQKPVYFGSLLIFKRALSDESSRAIDNAQAYSVLEDEDVQTNPKRGVRRGTQRNPEVHRKLSPHIMSESNALHMVRQLAADIQSGTLKDAKDNAATIVAYCDELLGQISKGVHANPNLTTFMANPGKLMSRDVQLIVYRHVEDGEFYAHQFGGKDVRFKAVGGRQVIDLTTLPRRTGVDMRTNGRTVTLSRPDGKPMSEDF